MRNFKSLWSAPNFRIKAPQYSANGGLTAKIRDSSYILFTIYPLFSVRGPGLLYLARS